MINNIEKLKNSFDFIILDCPPTLGILAVNAIYAANIILISTNYDRYLLDGMVDLLQSINNNDFNIILSKAETKLMTFRLREIDQERLIELLGNINKVNKSHAFNKFDLLRGVIMYALETGLNKVLNFIRKSI